MIVSVQESSVPLTFAALNTIVLRIGDSDITHRWGGAMLPKQPGTPVAEMQCALKGVGIYTGTVDGVFGHGTQLALRRFTWFMISSRYRLHVPLGGASVSGRIEQYTQNTACLLTDRCNATLAAELARWNAAGAMVTSTLVRVKVARFKRIERSTTFETLDYPSASDDEVLASQDFVAGLDSLDAAAVTNDVSLRLNQTFRRQNVPPTGAVVTPATKSQHLIGHAVDLNIVDGQTVVTSTMFNNNTASAKAKKLVADAKAAGLRWGGDFTPKDPPHFDAQVLAGSEDYMMNFYFCQRFYTLQHRLRLVF